MPGVKSDDNHKNKRKCTHEHGNVSKLIKSGAGLFHKAKKHRHKEEEEVMMLPRRRV
jgi:hypothetical protein